jgi:hypothetical protein
MNVLYSNGDSFVFGMECLGDFNIEETNKEYAFSKHLADQLNCTTYINNAYNGATNDFIFRNTIFDLLELEKNGVTPSDVFVLVGWTALHRLEIAGENWYNKIPGWEENKHDLSWCNVPEFKDHGTLFVNPSSRVVMNTSHGSYSTDETITPFCVDYLWHDYLQILQQEARIIALHEFLKSRGYRHLFVNTCDNYQFKKIDNLTPNYYNLESESFSSWALTHYKSEHRANNHFSPVPHSAYGKLLFDYLINNKL